MVSMIECLSLLLLLLLLPSIYTLENGLARLPPMGWMSWTAFYCETDCAAHPNACINEQLYQQMADKMVSGGYRDAGYVSVHVDDCWMAWQRDEDGNLIANNSRFPSGMNGLADYMHSKGLKFGIYEDYGTKTCGGYPGSYGYLKEDADIFAKWQVDYLKLDGCNIEEDMMPIGYPEMSQFLADTGRPIVYSCSWPAYLIDEQDQVDYNKIGKYCNLWRNFDDVSSSYDSILGIIRWYNMQQDKLIPSHGPGHWHDPDMLVAGNTGVTADQARIQMSVWSIWSAPLIMSNDLRNIGAEFQAILLNKDVIAVDQDPLGKMGRLITQPHDTILIYTKIMNPIENSTKAHSYAVAVVNTDQTKGYNFSSTLVELGLTYPYGYRVKNLWTGVDLGVKKPSDSVAASLNPTSVFMFKATVGS